MTFHFSEGLAPSNAHSSCHTQLSFRTWGHPLSHVGFVCGQLVVSALFSRRHLFTSSPYSIHLLPSSLSSCSQALPPPYAIPFSSAARHIFPAHMWWVGHADCPAMASSSVAALVLRMGRYLTRLDRPPSHSRKSRATLFLPRHSLLSAKAFSTLAQQSAMRTYHCPCTRWPALRPSLSFVAHHSNIRHPGLAASTLGPSLASRIVQSLVTQCLGSQSVQLGPAHVASCSRRLLSAWARSQYSSGPTHVVLRGLSVLGLAVSTARPAHVTSWSLSAWARSQYSSGPAHIVLRGFSVLGLSRCSSGPPHVVLRGLPQRLGSQP